jgi:hypothetical protein
MTDQPSLASAPRQSPSAFARPAVIAAIVGAFVIGAVLGVAGADISSAVSAAAKPKPAAFSPKAAIDKALTGCSMTQVADGVGVSDGGKTLTIDGEGNDGGGLAIDKEFCLLKSLKMPDSIRQDMGQTRALDGAQSGSWGHWDVTWRYHPDDGLDMVVTASK